MRRNTKLTQGARHGTAKSGRSRPQAAAVRPRHCSAVSAGGSSISVSEVGVGGSAVTPTLANAVQPTRR